MPRNPKAIQQALIHLQNRHAVFIFRNTNLNNDRQVSFSKQLGELEINHSWGGSERVGSEYLFDVSNLEADGGLVKKDSRRWHHALGNALWHTDSSFNQHRSKYSLLLSHTPSNSSDSNTFFADTRLAFHDLPEEKKAYLRTLIVEHSLWHSRKLDSPTIYHSPTADELVKKPPSCHKLVQLSPSGEQETLFLAAHAKRVFLPSGNEVEDSQKLVWDLIQWCAQEKYVFAAEWRESGTLMWWDNRQCMHRASGYSEGMGRRDVRRATVVDDGREAWGMGEEVIGRLGLRG
ncbi:Clavaminate synthase-like protein [Mollisia scopiformis]|uniref:Clavaminate synthase-like protein n=1 Tax=Mollisia scopiformis TaxID=149040 RepID=A0A194XG11_MOLSC|nr:Clavaminate synthase-like protein [Mollisia scopiformis]KUJ19135.1 Clavaminate synthase-like protein [Mollisia scopiformis]